MIVRRKGIRKKNILQKSVLITLLNKLFIRYIRCVENETEKNNTISNSQIPQIFESETPLSVRRIQDFKIAFKKYFHLNIRHIKNA